MQVFTCVCCAVDAVCLQLLCVLWVRPVTNTICTNTATNTELAQVSIAPTNRVTWVLALSQVTLVTTRLVLPNPN